MSTSVFLDTDVLLDVLAKREPHYAASAEMWTACEQGSIVGHISVISFNNIYYIVRKLKDKKTAEQMIALLRDIFQPVPLDGQLLNQTIGAGMTDFEDAIQFHSAIRAGAGFIITRNVSHYPKSHIPIITPKEFMASWTPDKS